MQINYYHDKIQCVFRVVCTAFFCLSFLKLTVVVLIYTKVLYISITVTAREKIISFFLSFLKVEFEFHKNARGFQSEHDDEARVRAMVHPVVFEASYAARRIRCAQVQIQVRSCCRTRRRGRTT